MFHTQKTLPTAIVIALLCSSAASANPFTALSTSAENASVSVNMRYRFENVEQDNALLNANASTLRTRITASFPETDGWSAILELDNVTSLGDEDYNSTANGNTSYSVVADPVGSDINQVAVTYSASANTFVAGRQRIVQGGQRQIGGVAFRQNEQTYDALTYKYKSDGFSLDYSYVWQVNRIFTGKDDSVQNERFQSSSHFLTAKASDFTGYVYALDFSDAAALSSITLGVDYANKFGDLSVAASVAAQSDYGDNPVSYDALYYAASLAHPIGPVNLTAGFEVLGSDDGVASFSTPLATLHKFQGFADMFLATATPAGVANGIEDLYLKAGGKIGDVSVTAAYHSFSANEGGADYGSEIDLVAGYAFTPKVTGQLKFADYSADGWAVDTQKFWATLQVAF